MLLERWIVGIPFDTAAIKRLVVGRVQFCTGLPACHEIGIGDELTTDRHQFGEVAVGIGLDCTLNVVGRSDADADAVSADGIGASPPALDLRGRDLRGRVRHLPPRRDLRG